MSICVVSFSSRRDGNCARISAFLCSRLPDAKLCAFSDFEIHPCGCCRYECFEQGSLCPWIHDQEYELLDAITHSEMTYFILPDYCDYPCANFFIFNERSLCYFQNAPDRLDAYERVPKKAIVVSQGDGDNIRTALRYHAAEEIETLLLSARKYGKSSTAGDLLMAKQAVADLERFIGVDAREREEE